MRLFWTCFGVAMALHFGVYDVLSRTFSRGPAVEAAVQSPVFQLQLAPLPVPAPVKPVVELARAEPVKPQAQPKVMPQATTRPAIASPSVAKAAVERAPKAPSHPVLPRETPVAANSSRALKATAPKVPVQPIKREIVTRGPSFKEPPAPPKYPPLARRRSQEGTVWLSIHLDEFGRQKERRVLRSSGISSLDDAALEAVAG